MALTTIPGVETLRAEILSALITEVRAIYVRKTADETINNNSTLQNDDHLFVPVAANRVYTFEAVLFYSTNATANLKAAFTFPAGATLSWAPITYTTLGTNTLYESAINTWQGASGTANPLGGGGDYPMALLRGMLRTGSTAGTLQLQWAQNSATAVNSTVKADSYIEMWLRE